MTSLETSIHDCQSGKMESFAHIYEHFIDKIYRFVFHKTMDDIVAEDIVSDVFFKALKHIEGFSGTTEQELSSWIYRIAYNSVIDFYRTKKEDIQLDSVEDVLGHTTDHTNKIDNDAMLNSILTYLNTLSKEQKDIMIMRVWDDLTYKEISEITGKNINACKKIVSRIMLQIPANVTFLFLFVFIL